MTRWRTTRPAAACRRRGSIYVLVMSTAALVLVIGLSALMAARVESRIAHAGQNVTEARHLVQSAMHVAMDRITGDPFWRDHYTNDTWTAKETIDGMWFQFKLVDELDNDLANDGDHSVRLYARAEVSDAVRLQSVLLEVSSPPNLLLNSDMEDGTTAWNGVGIGGTCDLTSMTDTPQGGTAYLHVIKRGAPTAGPHQDVSLKLINGKEYHYDFWIRGGDISSTNIIALSVQTSSGWGGDQNIESWTGLDWHHVTGTLTPSWTGTAIGAYFGVTTTAFTHDMALDEGYLIEGDGPPTVKLVPVAGTWRRETG